MNRWAFPVSEAYPGNSQLWLGPLVMEGTLVEIPSRRRAGNSARSRQRWKHANRRWLQSFFSTGFSSYPVPSPSFFSLLLHSLHFSSSLLFKFCSSSSSSFSFCLVLSSRLTMKPRVLACYLTPSCLAHFACFLILSNTPTHAVSPILFIVFKYSPVRLPLIALASCFLLL